MPSNPVAHQKVLEWLIDLDYNGCSYSSPVTYTPELLEEVFDDWVAENAEEYDYDVFTILATKGIRASLDMKFLSERMNACAWAAWADGLFGDEEDGTEYYAMLDAFKRV